MARRSKEAAGTDAEDLLLVGRVGPAHGIRGEVKVKPETDDPERFLDLTVVFLGDRAESAAPTRVESARLQPTSRGLTVVLKLESVTTRSEAEDLRGALVFARLDDLPPLEEDEFYLHDLVGLDVVTEEGETVGRVADVMEMPGQPKIVVERRGMPDVMIPAVEPFIQEIDIEAGRLVIQAIEGLLE